MTIKTVVVHAQRAMLCDKCVEGTAPGTGLITATIVIATGDWTGFDSGPCSVCGDTRSGMRRECRIIVHKQAPAPAAVRNMVREEMGR